MVTMKNTGTIFFATKQMFKIYISKVRYMPKCSFLLHFQIILKNIVGIRIFVLES